MICSDNSLILYPRESAVGAFANGTTELFIVKKRFADAKRFLD